MFTDSVAYRSVVAVDLFNINKVGLARKKTQEFSPDFLIQFVESLENLELKLPIVYLGDSHLPWILKKFRKAGKMQEDWFEDRISLPNNDPKKFWFVSKKIVKADYLLLELHNQFRALIVSRDLFRDEIATGMVTRPVELLRFECVTNDLDNSIVFVGKSYGCLNASISSYDKPELDDSKVSEIREIAINSLREQLQVVKKKYTSQKSRSNIANYDKPHDFGPIIDNKKEKTKVDSLKNTKAKGDQQAIESGPVIKTPRKKIESHAPIIEYSSVSLYNTDAMLKACDTNVLLIGTPAFDHRTSLWVLKWPMYPKVVHLSPEASAAIANLSQTPSLLGLKGHLKQLSASGDVYELSDFVGLVHGLHPELFREKSETSVIFSKWGYSLAHQLHQWRKRNTKVIEFSNSAPAESSHPDSVNSKTEDSQSVIKPERPPVVHPPKSQAQPIPAEPKFQPPTPPPTNPQPRVIKPLSPVDKTSHEKPSSTPGQSPPTDSIQEPERSHTGSEKNSKWAIVWVMAAVASLLAVISQIL
jgi:hypothetical protein